MQFEKKINVVIKYKHPLITCFLNTLICNVTLKIISEQCKYNTKQKNVFKINLKIPEQYKKDAFDSRHRY